MMRMTMTGLLALGILGFPMLFASAQQQNNPNRPENRNRSARNSDQADADDSWEDWFSDWWSDDEESRRMTDDQHRGNPNRWGVAGFMNRHDEDDNGSLSREELPKRMQKGFDKLDQNGDDSISQSELSAHAEKFQSQRQTPVAVTYIWVIDADQGRTNLKELQQAYDVLQKIDRDEDGSITRNELRQRHQQIASQWIDHCFQKLDKNDDDEITRKEAKGTALAQRFDRLDRNSDDALTRGELRTAAQASNNPSDDESEAQQTSANRREQTRPVSTKTTVNDDDDQ